MMKDLIEEAKEAGIPNPSLYYFLPPEEREKALRKAIEDAKKSANSEDA